MHALAALFLRTSCFVRIIKTKYFLSIFCEILHSERHKKNVIHLLERRECDFSPDFDIHGDFMEFCKKFAVSFHIKKIGVSILFLFLSDPHKKSYILLLERREGVRFSSTEVSSTEVYWMNFLGSIFLLLYDPHKKTIIHLLLGRRECDFPPDFENHGGFSNKKVLSIYSVFYLSTSSIVRNFQKT